MPRISYKEIAGITGTPIGTVMSRLHRGRRKLRHLLHDYAAGRGLATIGQAGPSHRRRGPGSGAPVIDAVNAQLK